VTVDLLERRRIEERSIISRRLFVPSTAPTPYLLA
jgi:hypothetical protein